MKDLVSIILPCYKSEKHIRNILDDVHNQTYPNWELIIVSNGDSQDAQLEIVNSYGGGNLKIYSEKLCNVSHARNVGIEHSKGQWLMFIDADDRIAPNHIQSFMDVITESPDIIVAGYTLSRTAEKKEKIIGIERHSPNDINIKKYIRTHLDGAINIVWNKIFRASFVKESGIRFNETYTCLEDAVFVLQLCLQTDRISTIPLCGYMYIKDEELTAVSKYHACREEATHKRMDLMSRLMRQAGFTEIEIANDRRHRLSKLGNGLAINLFRIGCPLSFKEKVAEIKRIAYDDLEVRQSLLATRYSEGDTYQKIFRLLYRAQSPALTMAVYRFMFTLRHTLAPLYNKIRACVH